jgi:hypothetical protein
MRHGKKHTTQKMLCGTSWAAKLHNKWIFRNVNLYRKFNVKRLDSKILAADYMKTKELVKQ